MSVHVCVLSGGAGRLALRVLGLKLWAGQGAVGGCRGVRGKREAGSERGITGWMANTFFLGGVTCSGGAGSDSVEPLKEQ